MIMDSVSGGSSSAGPRVLTQLHARTRLLPLGFRPVARRVAEGLPSGREANERAWKDYVKDLFPDPSWLDGFTWWL